MWARPAEVARPDTGTAGAAAQLKQLCGVVTSCSCTAQHSTAEAAVWRGYFLLLQLVSYQLWWACILPAVVWLLSAPAAYMLPAVVWLLPLTIPAPAAYILPAVVWLLPAPAAYILAAVVWLLPVTSLAAVDSSWVAVFSSFAPCCFPFLP